MKHKSEDKLIGSMLVKYCIYASAGERAFKPNFAVFILFPWNKPTKTTHKALIICTTAAHTGGSYKVSQERDRRLAILHLGLRTGGICIYSEKDFEEVMTVGRMLFSSSVVRLIHSKSTFKPT